MKAKDLKNSILQMAVQGKLVPQDSNDEPASVLLERIRKERSELIAEKKIKFPKGGESVIYRASDGSHYEKRIDAKGHVLSDACIDDEIPFEIPNGWEWARLGSALELNSGLGYKKDNLAVKDDCMMRVLRGGNIGEADTPIIKDNDVMISSQFVDDDLILQNGQIITPAVTSLENVGKAAIVRTADGNTVCGGFVFFLTPYLEIDWHSEYLLRYLTSPPHVSFCRARVKKSGQAFYNLSKTSLNSALIPLPPLAEQRRIAERVEELMPLVDEYGVLEESREALDSELPERLQKSVLQRAVQGKLVPRDPSDEPASVLLERIREERTKLVAEKKVKFPKGGESVIYRASDGGYYEKRIDAKGRVLSDECIDDEIPFEVPEGWEWVRLGCLFDMQAGKNISASLIDDTPSAEKAIPCFGGNGVRGFVAEANRFESHQVIGRQGALCGCVNYAEGPFYATEHAVVVSCFGGVGDEWAGLILTGLNLNQYATATAQPGLSVSKISDVLTPLPPLTEQRRIARRVNEVFAYLTNQ